MDSIMDDNIVDREKICLSFLMWYKCNYERGSRKGELARNLLASGTFHSYLLLRPWSYAQLVYRLIWGCPSQHISLRAAQINAFCCRLLSFVTQR